MNKSDPKRGDRSDDPTGLQDLWQDRPAGHLDRDVVRTDSSNADDYQVSATPTDSARSQSERDLDLPEPRGSGEGRASGKREHRPERTENDAVGVPLSAGWRAVAESMQALEGSHHEH